MEKACIFFLDKWNSHEFSYNCQKPNFEGLNLADKNQDKEVSTNDDRLPNWPGLLVPIKRHESHLIQTQDNPRTQIMWRWQAQFSNLAELQIAKTVTMRTRREAIFWSRFCLIVFFWLIQLEIWKWSSICRFFKFLKNLLKCFWMYSKVHQLVFNLSLWWISC